MKFSAKLGYQFNPSAAPQLIITAPGFDVRNLYAVVNITTANQPIYLQGISGFGASVDPTGRQLTLAASLAGMNATDTLVFTYDDGTDNLQQLVSAATGVPDPSGNYPKSPGILTKSTTTEDLLRMLIANVRVLTRVTVADKNVNDTDLDAMLQDELASANTIF